MPMGLHHGLYESNLVRVQIPLEHESVRWRNRRRVQKLSHQKLVGVISFQISNFIFHFSNLNVVASTTAEN